MLTTWRCKRLVRIPPPPEKADAVMALKKIIADAYFCGAAELWELLEESNQDKL